jgi:hypothetical protein
VGAKVLLLACVPFVFVSGLYVVGELNQDDKQKFTRVILNLIGGKRT